MSLGTVAFTETEEKKAPTILVSAPGSGIGKVLIPRLLDEGYNIVAIGSERSKYFVQFLSNQGHIVEFVPVDYNSEESIIEAFERLKAIVPKLDGMIHLVGGSLISKRVEDITLEDFKKVVELNLYSSFLIGRETYKWMKETGGGNLVFFGSTTGIEPSEKKLPYAAGKGGVHILAKAFALEGSRFGIISNVIAPGYVMTDRHVDELQQYAEKNQLTIEEAIEAKVKRKNPLMDVLHVEDIVPVVKLLLQTSKMQGQVITVDLGQTNV